MTRKIVISIIVVVCGLLFISHCFHWDKLAIDDAYITFRYAQNLNDGLGLVYNEGERIEGYSNLSWLLMIAAAMKLGCDPIISAKCFSLLFGIVGLLAAAALARRLAGRGCGSGCGLLFLLCPLLIACSPHFCFWTFSGMETVFFGSLIVLAAFLYVRESGRTFAPSAVVLSAIVLTRPEGMGYALVFAAADLIQRKTVSEKPRPCAICFHGILAASVAGLIAFRLVYFGEFLPNTYYAKPAPPFLERNFLYLVNYYLLSEPGLLFLLALSAGMLFGPERRRALLLWGVVLFGWFFIAHASDWMPNYRFHVHTLPVVAVLAAAGSARFASRFKAPRSTLVAAALCAGIAVVQCIVNLQIDVEARSYDFETRERKPIASVLAFDLDFSDGIRPPLSDAAVYLIENGPPAMTVAARDIGFIGFITGCTIYDLSMINNTLARRKQELFRDDDSGEIRRFIFGPMKDELLAADPDVVIYPRERDATTWGRYQRMLFDESITNGMAVVQADRKRNFTQTIYAKRSTPRPSRGEIVSRYREIVERNPHYLFLQKRLEQLAD